MGDASVIDQYIQAAEAFGAGVQQLLVQGCVGDIARQPQYPLCAQLVHTLGQALGVDVGEQQVAALGVIGARKLPAEAAGGPGNQYAVHYFSPTAASCAGTKVSAAGGRRDQ